ncbi:hypothetical protein [Micromonospora sp. WMMD710]|uniref:hypothetical protein n=1 Tax=Micromonospora sp. WMMD710 TaxID=3016085 RepID=UPI0024164710|nr:hypothetical protein [Micromonospora sp. WMMD710]MDG4762375.1 hypothetical protein [Micromonospora sp. WMMD710]MDG4762381.1 hypothetical protein [Micromonospora sp. WMMD710]MDG4762421.1 hypothetical protein [Micromonospora sp. WMMD710]MDG4762467.1 hypothetical protein [Micromonospora sp. WMMD710]MDG4762502.1 hypothetical protein [Micromonospora sp. WMMD710]
MKIERVIRIALDLGCILVGLGGIVHQTVLVPPGQASEALLVTFVSVLGIPAGVGLLSLRSSGGTTTASGPSPSPAPDSPPPPSSSPSPTPSGAAEP